MDIEKLIERLRKHRIIYKTNYDKFSGGACTADCVNAADIISALWDENKRLKNKLSELAHLPFDEPGIGKLTRLMAENEKLRAELEKVKRERDAIEQDFRAFAKQWWEQDNGFPCRWCKFENSGSCEWKAKQPNEEKICAGRAFEWRGPQKED